MNEKKSKATRIAFFNFMKKHGLQIPIGYQKLSNGQIVNPRKRLYRAGKRMIQHFHLPIHKIAGVFA